MTDGVAVRAEIAAMTETATCPSLAPGEQRAVSDKADTLRPNLRMATWPEMMGGPETEPRNPTSRNYIESVHDYETSRRSKVDHRAGNDGFWHGAWRHLDDDESNKFD